MEIQETRLPASQSGVSTQHVLMKDMQSTNATLDDCEEWLSYVTEPIPYDLHDALSWNDPVVDLEYASLFQDVFQVNMNPQSIEQSK